MLAYRVDDMTCGHCASAITRAVRAVDADAQVQVDLAQHLVTVAPARADAQELHDAIRDAGYTPVPVPVPSPAAMPAPARAGCGCGGCR